MKRNKKGKKPQIKAIRLWTQAQAVAVVPYLAAIMRSVRENYLEMQRHQLAQRRFHAKPGRLDRSGLIAQQEALTDETQTTDQLQLDLEELQAIDIYVLDPVRGEALIPFANGEGLAWYVFSSFDEQPLSQWRNHEDPLEMRRPLSELNAAATEGTITV